MNDSIWIIMNNLESYVPTHYTAMSKLWYYHHVEWLTLGSWMIMISLTNLKGVSEPQVQKSFQRMIHPGWSGERLLLNSTKLSLRILNVNYGMQDLLGFKINLETRKSRLKIKKSKKRKYLNSGNWSSLIVSEFNRIQVQRSRV